MPREYPELPVLAVGVVLLDGDKVLLIERLRPPNAGRWSVPGGVGEVGESRREAALRELREETGLGCTLGPIVEILERIVPGTEPAEEPGDQPGAEGRPRFHYVIVDFLGTAPTGELAATSDAAAARFVPLAELAALPLTDDLIPVIERSAAIRDGAPLPPYEPSAVLVK